ncbi:MAG: hypothetical protein AB7D51_08630 [Desulfovibrionaceae bacterium]
MSEQAEHQKSREQRIAAYEASLDKLRKDRVTLREVQEREILLGFIRTNRSAINEFPLLETQQQTVIELLCQRLDHPAYDYIRKLTSSFIVLLGHLRKAKANNDKEQLEAAGARLSNIEVLLIKCMQGIVYSMGLIIDNIEELVITLYGKAAMDEFSAMLKERQLDRNFWKGFFERFVVRPVAQGHETMLRDQRFSLAKEGRMLVVRFAMDAVMEQMTPATGELEKTRLQRSYEAFATDADKRAMLQVAHAAMAKGLAFIPPELLSKNDVVFLTRTVCIDPAAETLRELSDQRREGTLEDNEENRARLRFLHEQLTALGVGAAIGVSITQQNIAGALLGLASGSVEALDSMGRNFEAANLRHLLLSLLEEHLVLRLREQAGEDIGKLQVLTSRARRANADEVDGLGLSKIRRSKLFAADPADEAHLLFKPRNDRELASTVKLLQLEPEPAGRIVRLWKARNMKTEIVLLLDLALLQRTTTNLQVRVQEILRRFGLVRTPEPSAAPMG